MKIIIENNLGEYFIRIKVPGPHGSTEYETHRFNSINDMKNMIIDYKLSRDEIVSIYGCDLDDLFEDEESFTEDPDSLIKEFKEYTGLKLIRDSKQVNRSSYIVASYITLGNFGNLVRKFNQNHRNHIGWSYDSNRAVICINIM